MRHTAIPRTFAVLTAAMLAVVIAPTAQAADRACSNASLSGTFAVVDTGVIMAPSAEAGPFADVGTLTFDKKGNTAGTAWVSQNGNIFQMNMSGTYAVNPDCTGTFTLNISLVGPAISLPPVHAFFVIDNDGKEFHSMSTDPGRTITTIGRLQFTVVEGRH